MIDEGLFFDADEGPLNQQLEEDELIFNESYNSDEGYVSEYDYLNPHSNPQKKINVDKYGFTTLLSNHEIDRKLSDKIRRKDKNDRATEEQVLDTSTRIILLKLLKYSEITGMYGCISTDKEANVYLATDVDGNQYAIKIYKTSIPYFRKIGYNRRNAKKMAALWAENEMCNLHIMYHNEITASEPYWLMSHVLVMSFAGKNGIPAPKLKDIELNDSKARRIYRDVVVILWKLYNECELVHADLSEYTMIYHENEVFVTDVSQSVERDHSQALEFLRRDCTNVTDFFRKKKVATMGFKDLFNFITDPTINARNMQECLDELVEKNAGKVELTAEEQVEEQVFLQQHLPKRMTEIVDYETDEDSSDDDTNEDSNASASKNDASKDDDDDKKTTKFVHSARRKGETLEEKKARKALVKQKQAENRRTKIYGKKKKTKK